MNVAAAADRVLVLRPGVSPSVAPLRALPLRFLRGMGEAQAGPMLERLLSLCGPAHRVAARLAWAALRDGAASPTPAQCRALRHTALREHLRHLWLDWPQHLAGRQVDADGLAALGGLWRALDRDEGFAAALGVQLLGAPLREWLRWRRQADASVALAALRRTHGAPAQALAGVAEDARRLRLSIDDTLETLTPDAWPALARAAFADDGFAECPRVAGRVAQTGAWARAVRRGGLPPADALGRLLGRLDDLAVLALDDDGLRGGTCAVDARHALAWVETARGVLVHLLAVDACGNVDQYRVVAPTQWNFHPDGVLARALAARAPGDPAPTLLAIAGDPCVPFAVEAAARPVVEADACMN